MLVFVDVTTMMGAKVRGSELAVIPVVVCVDALVSRKATILPMLPRLGYVLLGHV
jgi:hypothetical protein